MDGKSELCFENERNALGGLRSGIKETSGLKTGEVCDCDPRNQNMYPADWNIPDCQLLGEDLRGISYADVLKNGLNLSDGRVKEQCKSEGNSCDRKIVDEIEMNLG